MEYRQALTAGTLLVGEYRIAETLRQDGFSITYDAEDLQLKRHVLIKEYFPAEIADRVRLSTVRPKSTRQVGVMSWGRQRFIEEAQTLTKFTHPGIARIKRVLEDNNTAYVVIDAESWPTVLSWADKLRRQPTQNELDEIARQMLDALEVLHGAGVLVRDLSPDSIYIRDKRHLMLIDFGTAKSQFAARARKMHTVVRPGYSAPEQYLFEDDQQGPWTDIFSLGAVMYRLFTGRSPAEVIHRHHADDMAKAAAGAPKGYRLEFLKAIDRAMALTPAERPQTVAALRALMFDSSNSTGRAAAPAKAALRPSAPAETPALSPASDPESARPPPPAPTPAAPVEQRKPQQVAVEIRPPVAPEPPASASAVDPAIDSIDARRSPQPAADEKIRRDDEARRALPPLEPPRPAARPTTPATAKPAGPGAEAGNRSQQPSKQAGSSAATAARPAQGKAPSAQPAASANATAGAAPRNRVTVPASAVPRALLSEKAVEEDRLGFTALENLPDPDPELDPEPAPTPADRAAAAKTAVAASPVKSDPARGTEVDAMAVSNRRFMYAVFGIIVGLIAIIGLGLVTLERTLRQDKPLTAEQQAERERATEQKRIASETDKRRQQETVEQRRADDEARRQRAAEEAEAKRQQDAARLIEQKRAAEDAERRRLLEAVERRKKEEDARRSADQKRVSEEAERKRQEEATRLAVEQKRKVDEAQRLAEQKRLAEEAERKRLEEATRLAAEQKRKEDEAQRLAEQKRQAEEAERKRLEETARLAEQKRQEAEAQRLAEQSRIAEEAERRRRAEAQRQAELKRAEEEARRALDQRQAAEEAERKRLLQAAEQKRQDEIRRAAEIARKDEEAARAAELKRTQLAAAIEAETGREQLLRLAAQNPGQFAAVERRLTQLGYLRIATGEGEHWRKPGGGEAFIDCAACPPLVVVGAGQFQMGSPANEAGRQDDEDDSPGPGGNQVRVSIPRSLAVGRTEVTRAQFAAFVDETRHDMSAACFVRGVDAFEPFNDISWLSPGFPQTDDHPVACVSWLDAQAYVAWLSRKTGRTYRLLSEAEWEFIARGAPPPVVQPRYPFGNADRDLCAFANGADLAAKRAYPSWQVARCNDGYERTAPVASFEPNAVGVHDMLGNLWEWVSDCYHDSYRGQPAATRNGGAAWLDNCSRDLKVLRGGSWSDQPDSLRPAARIAIPSDKRIQIGGFRVVRQIEP